MEAVRSNSARKQARCVWIAGLVALLIGVTGARANVQPPTMLVIHVQGDDPSYCDLPGVDRCQDVVQTTEAWGDLLIVVYLVCSNGCLPGRLTSLDFTLQWGWSWSGWCCGVANCTDAEFSYENSPEAITVHFSWPDPGRARPFMPLCAIGSFTAGHDCIQILDDASINWGYPWNETPVVGRAEAGVECEYACLQNCDPWGYNSMPELTPEELRFEVSQGQGAEGLLQSVVDGYGSLCEFDATEPWVTLEVEQTSYYTHDVHVTVSAAGLAVGEYEARVRETCTGRDCSRIYLTVTEGDPQSIPDEESPPADEARPTTWGGVKDLYR